MCLNHLQGLLKHSFLGGTLRVRSEMSGGGAPVLRRCYCYWSASHTWRTLDFDHCFSNLEGHRWPGDSVKMHVLIQQVWGEACSPVIPASARVAHATGPMPTLRSKPSSAPVPPGVVPGIYAPIPQPLAPGGVSHFPPALPRKRTNCGAGCGCTATVSTQDRGMRTRFTLHE